MTSGDGGIVNRMAEIDTRAPFKSVKEAVSLFGERVLVGELYAPGKIKEMHKDKGNQHEEGSTKLGSMTADLQETMQILLKAREESQVMANCLSSLQDELERTKRELHELKLERESEKQMMELEIEDLKFVEDQSIEEAISNHQALDEFQKKRYVTFANASFSRVLVVPEKSGPLVLERNLSLKKKKQPLIPLMIGRIFSRKKKSNEVASSDSPQY